MGCSNITLKLKLTSVLWTCNIAVEVIKVDVTPPFRGIINEPDTSMLSNQVLHVPALTVHGLNTVTNLGSNNLQTQGTEW